MKHVILIGTLLSVLILGTNFAHAKGSDKAVLTPEMKAYKKSLRKGCGMTGIHFAHKHTYEEWKALDTMESFRVEVQKICPKKDVSKVSDKKLNLIKSFVEKYPSDDPEVPDC